MDFTGTSKRSSQEIRERAVRLVVEHQVEHGSHSAVIQSISGTFGCTAFMRPGGTRPQGQMVVAFIDAHRDEQLCQRILWVWEEKFCVYGQQEMRRQVSREQIRVARAARWRR